MDMVYGGRDLEELRPLLGERFSFRGPFLPCDSADAYIAALQDDPPRNFAYELIHASQTGDAACRVYWFKKSGLRVPMAHGQFFPSPNVNSINRPPGNSGYYPP